MTTLEIFFALLGMVYIAYTLSFAIYFKRTTFKNLSSTKKRSHSILIWFVPFIWIIVIKEKFKPIRNTRYRKKKESETTGTSQDHNWIYSLFFLFHGSSYDPYYGHQMNEHSGHDMNEHSGHDTIGYSGHHHGNHYHDYGGDGNIGHDSIGMH
jgi:hypothetical protein